MKSAMTTTVLAMMTAAMLVSGCGKKPSTQPAASADKAGADKAGADKAGADKAGADKAGAQNAVAAAQAVTAASAAANDANTAAVAADGTNFDPPIAKDRVPAGAWYCDMGTVHFARMDKGDATCPRCKMKLHQK